MAKDKKQRRQHRLRRREQQKERFQEKLKSVTCPNCGDLFGTADQDEVIHRAGPCDCTPARRAAMNAFLEARRESYEIYGKINCPKCKTLHGEADQETHFFEGSLVWDGCATCFTAGEAVFEKIREACRTAWFGPRLATEPVATGKYLPATP